MQDSANEAISPWSLMHPSAKACVKVTIIAGKPRPVSSRYVTPASICRTEQGSRFGGRSPRVSNGNKVERLEECRRRGTPYSPYRRWRHQAKISVSDDTDTIMSRDGSRVKRCKERHLPRSLVTEAGSGDERET